MTRFADWCAFLGAWLLFAGPVYQAESELDQEGRELGELRGAMRGVPLPPPPSAWWWLLPPVAWMRHRVHARELRNRIVDALPPGQTAQLLHFREKATGWMFVGGGAALIGLDETWNLTEAYGWPQYVYWPLVVFMIVTCVVFTMNRAKLRAELLGLERRVRGELRGGRDAPTRDAPAED